MNTDLLDRADAPTALATIEDDRSVTMFERLAKDATVPVEKLERLIELQRSIQRDNAKAEFASAFARMQGEIPAITERGEIAVNGIVRSRYARFEDILDVVRPILTKHGFALRHRNRVADGLITVTGILSHTGGHSEEDEFQAKADSSGSKNDIQALGSTRHYGQRYTTISLLGIATKGADDDGQSAMPKPNAPAGYDDWLTDMQAVADEQDADKLRQAWDRSKPQFRAYLTKNNPQAWAAMKKKAGAL